MSISSCRSLAQTLSIVGLFGIFGCGGAVSKATSVQRDGKPASTSAQASQGSVLVPSNSPAAETAKPQFPTGPLQVMAGDPDAQTLVQVRLVPSSCENLAEVRRQLTETKIREMHQAIEASLERWRNSQPWCRARARELAERARHPGLMYPRSATKSAAGGYDYEMASEPESVPAAAPASGAKPESRAKGVRSASGTNNQVAGVDEADIVKHDRTHVFFAVNGALRIASIDPPKLVSETRLSGQVKDMFVEGNRAVVYTSLGGHGGERCTYGYDCQFAGDGSTTTINVYDVTQRESPKLVRQIGLSGSLMAARRIGKTIHTVVADGEASLPYYSSWPSDLQTCEVKAAKVKQSLAKLEADNERAMRNADPLAGLPMLTERGESRKLCENLARTSLADGKGFTTVVSFDMTEDVVAPTTATVQSRPGAIFASENALYLAVTHQHNSKNDGWYGFYSQHNEVSDIHKFRLGARPGLTRYSGSGVVPGHVLNQFAMDEWYGLLRVATTRGRVPDPKVESQVSILAESSSGNLIRTGAIEHLAPGEDIRSVRFDNDRGYVVTFKKTDPLFVLDLRRPDRPSVLGELKIPGFSTYIHRIDANHLLSIGLDANDHGDFAFFDGVILQLFDVTNPTDPQLIHKEKIGTRGSSSEAITNHLAFNYFRERGLLAIPMTICEGGGDGSNGNNLTFAGLLVYHVSVRDGFRRLGGVNHATARSNCSTWWSNATSAVKRSLFLDDWVWSIALDRAVVQKLSRLGEDEADLRLD